MKLYPAYKIVYVFVISTIIFVFNNIYITLGLLLVQLLLWVFLKIPLIKLKPLKRIRSFILILLFFYTFFYGDNDFVFFSIKKWSFGVNYQGFYFGLIMASKVLTMLLATFIMRFTTSTKDFMLGLKQLGLSANFSLILDNILSAIAPKPKKKNAEISSKQKKEEVLSVKSILKGNFTPIVNLINTRLKESRLQFSNNDIAVIAAFSTIVTFIRFMKIVPGFPIAPGHKNILIIPFFILGSKMTKKQFAGTYIGFLSGIIHFISGFGKYGPLGILQFALLGFVIDVLMLFFKKSNSIIIWGFIGIIAGLIRVFSEIFLAWLLQMPTEYYLFYLPFVTSQCLFGLLSAIVTRYLIKKIK